jgi:hypothetical protein
MTFGELIQKCPDSIFFQDDGVTPAYNHIYAWALASRHDDLVDRSAMWLLGKIMKGFNISTVQRAIATERERRES